MIHRCIGMTMPNDIRPAIQQIFWISASVCGLLAGCGPDETDGKDGTQQGAQRPAALVRVGRIIEQSLPYRIEAVGSIMPARTTIVASGADGIVAEFPVADGQFIKSGDTLSVLRMTSADLSISEAELLAAERRTEWEMLTRGSRKEELSQALARKQQASVDRATAARRLELSRQLFREGTTNQSELDDAIEAERAAVEAYNAAAAAHEMVQTGPREEKIEQARLRHQAQIARVDFLKNEREKRTTRAPFDGFIVQEMTQLGQWLAKGDPVATLVDLQTVELTVDIDQRDIRHVQLGQSVDVMIEGAPGPETNGIWRGTITAVVPQSDWKSGARGFPVRVLIENNVSPGAARPTPILKEGMIARVTFEGLPEKRLMAPKDSLVRSTRGVSLFTVSRGEEEGSATAQQVPVELGISSGGMIEVNARSMGDIEFELVPDQEVVTEGAERLRPVSAIRIRSDSESGDSAE